MDKKFFAFTEFAMVKQDKDKLCWAACLEALVAYFDPGQLTPNFQKLAAEKYLNASYRSIRRPRSGIYNVPINEKDIHDLYEEYQIEAKEYHDQVGNFNFYVDELQKNEFPLLLGVTTGSGLANLGHLLLVCGYGYCDDKTYLLLYNSTSPSNKPYIRINGKFLFSDSNPVRLWTLKIKPTSNIQLPQNKRLEELSEEKMASIQTHMDLFVLDQAFSLPYFNAELISDLDTNPDSNSTRYELVKQISLDPDTNEINICDWNKIPYEIGVIEPSEIDDDRFSDLDESNAEIIDISSSEIRVLKVKDNYIPLEFPERFDLNNISYTKEDLIERIVTRNYSETLLFNT